MYSKKDIDDWLAGGTNAGLQWFPAYISASRLAECLAGMANLNGGLILLGISPRGAEVHGVKNVPETIDSVFQATLLLEPPLVIPVPHSVDCRGKKVVVIQVPPGLPNVYSLEGRFWGRQGNQTLQIPAKRLRQLLIERGEIQFERRVPPGVRLEDLDFKRVRTYIEALSFPENNGKDLLDERSVDIQHLLRRGCLEKIDDRPLPTYAGLLMFSREPQQWLPSSLILAARFSGNRFSDEFARQEIRGPLPEQLKQAETFLRNNLRTMVRILGLSHQEVLEYPYEAVRELLVNAVAHRDYNSQGDTIHIHLFNDRLEIHSPGGLPGPVNLDNLLQARFARNAVITQLLADLGFVERLGYGLDRVVSAMEEAHLPPPKFEEVAGTFRVTLYNQFNQMQEKNFEADTIPALALKLKQDVLLNSRQELAIRYLLSNQRITNKDYQELCPQVHMETLRRDLADLVSQGVLMKIGDKRATYYILKENLIRKKA